MRITQTLAREQVGRILAVEPYGRRGLPAELMELGVEHVAIEQALEEADVLVMLVAHRHFRRLPRAPLQQKMVVDACGLLSLLQ